MAVQNINHIPANHTSTLDFDARSRQFSLLALFCLFTFTSIVIVNDTMHDRPVLTEVALKRHSKATLNTDLIAVCSTSGLMFY